jgi:hypothetical protein
MKCTLLDLVQAVSDYATSDDEIVATVAYLINSGKVQLCGNFAGARINLSTPASPVLRASTLFRKFSRPAVCTASQ